MVLSLIFHILDGKDLQHELQCNAQDVELPPLRAFN